MGEEVLHYILYHLTVLCSFFSYTPASFERHPDFNERTEDYDFAIITLAEPVTFNEGVVPICLPSTSNEDNRSERS